MKYTFQILTTLLTCSLFLGCGTLPQAGFPEQAYDEDEQIENLLEALDNANRIKAYYEENKAPKEKRALRDKIISLRLTLINMNYNRFVRRLFLRKQTLNTVTDIAVTGLDLAIPLVGGSLAKDILGVASGAIVSSKLSVDKNFFYEKTVAALVTTMNAQRKKALVPILKGMKVSTSEYPLAQALSDLDNYYFAGTLIGAVQSIQVSAGTKEAEADIELERLRSGKFWQDTSSKRIKKWLWPKGIKAEPDQKNVKRLKEWIAGFENGRLKGIPIETLLHTKELGEVRKRAIEDLEISE